MIPCACLAAPEIALCRAEVGLEGLSSLCQAFIWDTMWFQFESPRSPYRVMNGNTTAVLIG